MRQIGTIAANARGDRLACLGMIANSARQAEKLYRPFKVKVFTGNITWNGVAHRLLTPAHFDIGSETARLTAHVQPSFRMLTQALMATRKNSEEEKSVGV